MENYRKICSMLRCFNVLNSDLRSGNDDVVMQGAPKEVLRGTLPYPRLLCKNVLFICEVFRVAWTTNLFVRAFLFPKRDFGTERFEKGSRTLPC